MSDSRIIFHAPKTWLHIRFLCQTTVRQLYNLHSPKTWLKVTVISLPGLKDLVSSQGFNVGIHSNIWTVFHAPKTWLDARVLMSVYCQTVVQFSMHQRPGFTPGFWCQAPVRQLYNPHAPKTLLKATALVKIRCLQCKNSFDKTADWSDLSQFAHARRPILLSTAQFNFLFKEWKSEITESIYLVGQTLPYEL